MVQSYGSASQAIEFFPALEQQRQRQLLRAFWLIALALFGYEFLGAKTDSALSNIGAAMITFTALLPSYLWCAGRAQGMPIFPLFALTYVWTHALPLVTNHPLVIQYSPDSQLFASLTVSGFLGLGTWVWFQFVKFPPPLPRFYRALSEDKGDSFFLLILAIAVLFNVANAGGWLFLSGGVFTAIRSTVLGLSALASFVLSYRIGKRELTRQKARLFLLLLVAYMITSAISLLLIGTSSTFLVSTFAFIIGRRKIPFTPILIMIVFLSLLHYGKGEMRAKYWFEDSAPTLQPWDYPAWYSEWIGYSWEYLSEKKESSQTEEKASFVERSSIIQMLLLAQTKSPDSVPFMNGETYAILPQLIVPRILNSNKIRSAEGTHLLSVHYGLQTYDQTLTTSISWGLLAEAYANFGLGGCAGLAIVLGWVYGKVTRWSANAPILSAQSLFSVLMITFALQTEWSAGVYVAALSQASTVLGVMVVGLMKTYWMPSSAASYNPDYYT